MPETPKSLEERRLESIQIILNGKIRAPILRLNRSDIIELKVNYNSFPSTYTVELRRHEKPLIKFFINTETGELIKGGKVVFDYSENEAGKDYDFDRMTAEDLIGKF